MESFWKQLKNVQAGANTLGQINLIGTYLQAQLGEPGIETGIIRVEANPLAFGVAGYALRHSPWRREPTERNLQGNTLGTHGFREFE